MSVISLLGLPLLGLSLLSSPPVNNLASENIFNVYKSDNGHVFHSLNNSYELTTDGPELNGTIGKYIYYDENNDYHCESKWINYVNVTSNPQSVNYNCFYLSFNSNTTKYWVRISEDGNNLVATTTAPDNSETNNSEKYYFAIKKFTNSKGVESITDGEETSAYLYNPATNKYVYCIDETATSSQIGLTDQEHATKFNLYGRSGRITLASNEMSALAYRKVNNEYSLEIVKMSGLNQGSIFTFEGLQNVEIDGSVKQYDRVENINQLSETSKVAIVANASESFYGISIFQASLNRIGTSQIDMDDELSFLANPTYNIGEFTINKNESDYYTIYDAKLNGYLSSGEGNNNRLLTSNEINGFSTWNISLDATGTASISSIEGSRNKMCYNSQNTLFSCYEPNGTIANSSKTYIYKLRGNADMTITKSLAYAISGHSADETIVCEICPLYYYPASSSASNAEPLDLSGEEIAEWLFNDYYVQIRATPLLKQITLINKPNYTLLVGDEFQLTYSRTPYYADEDVIFSSSQPSIISVDQTGKLVALATGTATITLTGENGATTSCIVNAHDYSSIEVHPTKTTFNLGDTFEDDDLTITVYYTDSTSTTISSGYTLSTPNMNQEGYQTITVTYLGMTTTYEILVTGEETFAVSPHQATLHIGESLTIEYQLHTYQTNVEINGVSSNSSIASVNNLTIKALSAGTATITFNTSINLSDTCVITVLEQDTDDEPIDNDDSSDENDDDSSTKDGDEQKDDGKGSSEEPNAGSDEGQTPEKGDNNEPISPEKEKENLTVGIVAGAVAIAIVGGSIGTIVGVSIHKKKKRKQ